MLMNVCSMSKPVIKEGVWDEGFEHPFHFLREKGSDGACIVYKHAHAFMFERWVAVVVSHV